MKFKELKFPINCILLYHSVRNISGPNIMTCIENFEFKAIKFLMDLVLELAFK